MKPIIFSTPMVQAIFEGRKTMTRRVMKPVNAVKAKRMGCYHQGNGLWIHGYTDAKEADGSIKDYSISSCWQKLDYYIRDYAPYKPGDVLWVREMWQVGYKESPPCDIETWNKLSACVPCHRSGECEIGHNHPWEYLYKASPETYEDYDEIKWRPSIHMPREAARIFLRVMDVRVERVQDISEDDAVSEGCMPKGCECLNSSYYEPCPDCYGNGLIPAHYIFSELWDKINAKRDGGLYAWEQNPWVWVYTFERISREEAEI